TDEALAIRGLMDRAKSQFRTADIEAFNGNIFPRVRADGTVNRGAIAEILDDKFLCDIGVIVNPKMAGFELIKEPLIVQFDGEVTGVINDASVESLMATMRKQVEKVKGKTPAGGVYETPDGTRKGFIIVPSLGGVRTKSGLVIDMNDPRLFPLAKRYFRVIK